MKQIFPTVVALMGLLTSLCAGELEKNFTAPPAAFKPWVFFFFESQQMDLPGITADLESLSSVGVGGLIVFAEYREGMKDGSVKMFSPEYDAGMRHLLREAERLGLVVSLFNCAGSSTAGGPWNEPEHSMKQFVWSETPVAGGGARTLKLKQPVTHFDFYRDIAVMAYPMAGGGQAKFLPKPRITAPKGSGKLDDMMDGDFLTSAFFKGGAKKERREIRLDYAAPVTAGRFYIHGTFFKYGNPLNYELEVSDDGKVWRKIATASQQGNNATVMDFPAVTARHFRVWASSKTDNFWIAELDLLPPGGRPRAYPQFSDWAAAICRDKEAFDGFRPLLLAGDKPLNPAAAVDLTSRLQPDGSLAWDAPAGDWLVLRMGYTTSGKKTHPAKAEGTGFEVDKLDANLVRRQAEMGLRKMSGGFTNAPALKMFHLDSWEAGGQSWSENLAAEFERRNGYSLRPFLPVLGARLVTDADTTRRFLEDFRRTMQSLVAENFYGGMKEFANKQGLSLLAESSAAAVPIHRPLDFFQYVDIPAGEAWALGDFTSDGNISGGLRDAVSAAHILGKPMTPVEVFTCNRGNWNTSPRFLKPFGDKILAAGGNEMTLHCYIHQPSGDLAPGWTMNHYGTTFNRHVTWWNDAKPWLTSISRSQVMLRQGRSVMDFCRLLADDESLANYAEDRSTFWDAPAGFANDWITGGNLQKLFRVEQGEFVAAGGARYRLLVLPARDRMTLETARKLHELVEAGGVILGQRPTARVGLRGGAAADKEFAEHVTALWGGKTESAQTRTVGRGRVLTGMTVDAALAALNVKPDVTWTTADATVRWHHRRDDQREIYFLANGGEAALRTTFSFRVADRAPEIWSPETGEIRRPAIFRSDENRTELPLELGPSESIFVVFGPEAAGKHFESVTRDGQSLWPRGQSPMAEFPAIQSNSDGQVVLESSQSGEYALENSQHATTKVTLASPPATVELRGSWRVSFDGVAAPNPQVFEQLVAWNKHSDAAVRFFSGAGEYRQELTLNAKQIGGNTRTWIDLGEVRELAEVTVNGEALGVVWKPPFRLDVTGKLRTGRNEVSIRVVNTWANRLIGDAALPEAERHTWTSFKHYNQADELPDSGLLGPVTLRMATTVDIKP